jgi:hypothetical protein
MIVDLISLFVLSLAVAALSLTLTKAKVSAPARRWIKKKSYWLGELASCPYCMSHWLSFGMVAAFRPVIAHSGFFLLDLFVSAFAIVAIAAMAVGLIFKAIAAIPE